MRCTVSMMLAFGSRLMMSSTAGRPFGLAGVAQVLHRVDDLGHVGQAHRGAVAVGRRSAAGTRRRSSPGRWRRSTSARSPSSTRPLGRLALAAASALRTSSNADAVRVERRGVELDAHRRQRAAADRSPGPTPRTCDSFCASMVEAASYIWPRVMRVGGERMIMIGASAGFTLR